MERTVNPWSVHGKESGWSCVSGTCAGIMATVLWHPLDTLKTVAQSQKNVLSPQHSIRDLYKGIWYAGSMQVIGNGLLFGLYDYFSDGRKGVHYTAAFKTGIIEAFIYGFLEIKKARQQVLSPYTGTHRMGLQFSILTAKETMGNCIYFGTYYNLRKKLTDVKGEEWPSDQTTALAGGLAGIAFWAICYPLDTIRLRVQLRQPMFAPGLYNGYRYALVKAFPTNATIFFTYEKIKSLNPSI